MDSSDSLSAFATKKILEKIDRFSTKPIEAHMTFSVNNHEHHAQLAVKGGDGFNFQVEAVSQGMYGSIDLLVDKLEVQLRKKKERLKKHKYKNNIRHLGFKDDVNVDSDAVDAEDVIKFEQARQRKASGE
jgi:putative sigma-54 modulation protein